MNLIPIVFFLLQFSPYSQPSIIPESFGCEYHPEWFETAPKSVFIAWHQYSLPMPNTFHIRSQVVISRDSHFVLLLLDDRNRKATPLFYLPFHEPIP